MEQIINSVIPVSHRDLLEAPIPVALATVGPTGGPHVSAVWAVLEGDVLVMSLPGGRQTLKNIIALPYATVFVIDPLNQYRTLEVRGEATVEADVDLASLQQVISAYGFDLDSFPGSLEGRCTVRLRPDRVVTFGRRRVQD